MSLAGTRVLDQDLDLGGARVFNPRAPESSSDVVRLQDVAALAPSVDVYALVTRSDSAPHNAFNLGGLTTGVLQQTVSGSVATPSALAVAAGAVPFGDTDGRLTYDSGGIAWDATNHLLTVSKSATSGADMLKIANSTTSPTTGASANVVFTINTTTVGRIRTYAAGWATGSGTISDAAVVVGNPVKAGLVALTNDGDGFLAYTRADLATTGVNGYPWAPAPDLLYPANPQTGVPTHYAEAPHMRAFVFGDYLNQVHGAQLWAYVREFSGGTQTGNGWHYALLDDGIASATAASLSSAYYLVTSPSNKPTNAIDLSTLGSGVLQQFVSGGAATMIVSALSTNYVPFAGAWGQLLSDSGLQYFVGTSGGLVVSQRVNTPEILSTGALTFKANSTTRGGFDSSGNAYFANLSTSTVALVIATDTTGHVATATIGSGLSYSGGTLSATGVSGITQLTGDVTAGPGSGSQAATLASTSVTPGTYTYATVTFDAKGRATSASDGWSALVSAFAPADGKFIVQQAHFAMPNAQVLASLGTGLVKNTTSTGVLSIATAGVDYQAALSLTSGSVLFSGGGSTVSQDNSNFFWDSTNHRLGLGTTSPATTLDVEGRITIGPHATGPRVQMLNPDNTASLAQVQFYPGDGTNTGTSFAVVPKGTGLSSSVKAQFSVFNTDYIADSSNYEFCVFRAAGTEFDLVSSKAGTGTARPLNVQASTTGAAVSGKGITFNTDGTVSIGTVTAGSVVFAGTSGLVSDDNGNLYYDAANHRLVLGKGGTYTPTAGAPLTVSGVYTGDSWGTAIGFDKSGDQGITKSGSGTLYLANKTTTGGIGFISGTGGPIRAYMDNVGNWTMGSSGGDGATLQINAESSFITIGVSTNQVKAGLYVANSYPQYANIVTDMHFVGRGIFGYDAQSYADLNVAAGGSGTYLRLGYNGDAASGSMTEVITIGADSGNGAIAFFAGTPTQKQVVSGSRSSGAALLSLLAALSAYNFIHDTTSS
jgi:hypothetical protein